MVQILLELLFEGTVLLYHPSPTQLFTRPVIASFEAILCAPASSSIKITREMESSIIPVMTMQTAPASQRILHCGGGESFHLRIWTSVQAQDQAQSVWFDVPRASPWKGQPWIHTSEPPRGWQCDYHCVPSLCSSWYSRLCFQSETNPCLKGLLKT